MEPHTAEPMPQGRTFGFEQVRPDGQRSGILREIAEEIPVALEYQGMGYAVLMTTPSDLEDLAFGFSLSERLVDEAAQIKAVDIHPLRHGIVVRITLREDVAHRIVDRVRHRTSDSSCGLCGVENLEQALRPLPRITAPSLADDVSCFRALAALEGHQILNQRTGAVHVSAACSVDGDIRLAREDIGRHNAFDKLVGAMMRRGMKWDGGFALISSRCSYEMVEKAVLSGCPMLAAISAPTALALDRATAAGLRLRTLVRDDSLLAFQSW